MGGWRLHRFYAGSVGLIPVMLHAAAVTPDFGQLQTKLGIPASIAKIVDASSRPGEGTPEIIIVQDIHRHPEVQGHIAAIVLHGVHHWGLQDVYLEGASADATVRHPPAGLPQSLRAALADGRLSGAEMAAALEPSVKLELHGLEDPVLYRKDVEAYDRVEQLRNPAYQELATARLLETSLDVGARDKSSDSSPLLSRLLQLRLKPSEVVDYENDPYTPHEGTALAEALFAAKGFYDLADQRSEAFIRNLGSDFNHGPKMVVVGGYHTLKMAEKLRQAGRTFVVLSPQVTQSGYEELYARGMEQTISALKLH